MYITTFTRVPVSYSDILVHVTLAVYRRPKETSGAREEGEGQSLK